MKPKPMTDPDDGPTFQVMERFAVRALEMLAAASVLGVIAVSVWLFHFLWHDVFGGGK